MRAVLSSQISETIDECFRTDKDLVDLYHIASGDSVEKCIVRTIDDLFNTDPSFKFYQLHSGNQCVGFFGSEFSNYLTTIFIKPEYRNRKDISEIWKLISSHFDDEFYTSIYSKNTRALTFYRKNGIEIEEFNAGLEKAVSFKFKKENTSCP